MVVYFWITIYTYAQDVEGFINEVINDAFDCEPDAYGILIKEN